MSKVFTIWRRELASLFLSPVAYVTMIVFLSVVGFTFWLTSVRGVGAPEPLSVLLAGSIVFWLPIIITVVSMRLFVEEKRSGTIETLLTAPVTDAQVVLGKYCGALSFLLITIFPAFLYIWVFERLSPVITLATLDVGATIGAALIILLVTAQLLSVALVGSLVTRNQIIAAICAFVGIWLALLLGWLWGQIPGMNPVLGEFLSLVFHIEEFARGVIVGNVIVLHLATILFMLFVAVRVLEARRWR
jgi:ABC-2 type transport system permease protein